MSEYQYVGIGATALFTLVFLPAFLPRAATSSR